MNMFSLLCSLFFLLSCEEVWAFIVTTNQNIIHQKLYPTNGSARREWSRQLVNSSFFLSFTPIKTSTSRIIKRSRNSSLSMRDSSIAYWFQKGDKVLVKSSVLKGGVDLIGRVGVVIEAWEKCDVDPTCCCAEFVDDNFAVTVNFKGPLLRNSTDHSIKEGGLNINHIKDTDDSHDDIRSEDNFIYFFNEDELEKYKT